MVKKKHSPADPRQGAASAGCATLTSGVGQTIPFNGGVGPTAAAKRLDEEAVRLAVVAHVRHMETGYDEILASTEDGA